MMDLRDEIARKLNEQGWTCDGGSDEPGQYDECEDCKRVCDKQADALMPLVRKAQEEARVAELREMADSYVDLAFLGWPHNVDAREVAEYFEDRSLTRADAIEQNSEGNET